jgi:UDP-GlcNAc:undecaprenyl-phosphate GlcNAc-1-phosphate transferase
MSEHAYWGLALAFGVTIAATALLIPLARHVGLVDHPTARKRHGTATPLVGGLAMFFALFAGIFASGIPLTETASLIAGSVLLIAFGVVDDLRDLSYRVRLIVQAAAGAILVYGGDMRIDSLGNLLGFGPIDLGPLAIPFTIFAVVGLINAVNMLDGLDGLAGAVTLSILLPLLAFTAGSQPTAILVPALLFTATIIAFLLFNYRFPWRRRALVFMGDSGSNFLGFVLSWLMLSLLEHQGEVLSPMAILWIVGFPVADTLVTMYRRHRKGVSAFQPDRDHVHYVLQKAGFGINASVLIISGVSAMYALIGIAGSLDRVPEPVLFLGYLLALAIHFAFLKHAWKITKKFRHLLTVPHMVDD